MRIEQWWGGLEGAGGDYRPTQSAEDQDSTVVHSSIDFLGLGRGDFGVSACLSNRWQIRHFHQTTCLRLFRLGLSRRPDTGLGCQRTPSEQATMTAAAATRAIHRHIDNDTSALKMKWGLIYMKCLSNRRSVWRTEKKHSGKKLLLNKSTVVLFIPVELLYSDCI